MCLYIHSKQPRNSANKYVPIRTTRHYLVWKAAQNRGSYVASWFRYDKYVFGKERGIKKLGISYGVVERGLHALRKKTSMWRGVSGFWRMNNLYPSIIPAGSDVVYGDSGDVVSNRLIVFRNIEELNAWCKANPVKKRGK